MYQPFARMFFKLSYRYLDLKFTRIPSSRASDSAQNEANDPQNMASISAHATLPWNLEMNVAVRYVDSRPDPVTESYTVADVRIGWAPSRNWDIALIGRNLFTGLHRELVTPNSLNELIRPSGTLKVTWRF
jgi:outer membrane receptor protein involved in Fe transport